MHIGPFELLEQQAKQHPHSPAIYYAGKMFTYTELLSLTRKLAKKLTALGIEKSQLIGLYFANPFLGWAISLALFQKGSTSCSLTSIQTSSNRLAFDFYLSDNSAFQTNQENNRFFYIDTDWIEEISSTEELTTSQPYVNQDAICRIVMSSGSTGEAKGVPLTVELLLERSHAFINIDPNYGCELLLSDTSNSVGLYKAIASLISGKPFSFGYSYSQIERDLTQIPITNIIGSPLQLSALAGAIEPHLDFKFDYVKKITSLGSALSLPLVNRLSQIFNCSLQSIYGATELGPIAVFPFNLKVGEEVNHEEGIILPFAHIEVVDKRGNPLMPDLTGELRVKSSLMTHGYMLSEQGKGAFQGGWFYPGDLGCVTQEGRLKLSGRLGELFNVGGVKVNPREIDAFLLGQTGVQDALSCTIDNKQGVDQVYVGVVLTDHSNLSALRNSVISHFSGLFDIRLIAVKYIPQTQGGKPSRAQMRNLITKLKCDF